MTERFRKNVGARLRSLRDRKGLKQKVVAEAFDLSITGVGKWERGKSLPEPEKLPLIASFYGVTIDWILTGDEPLPAGFAEKVAVLTKDRRAPEPSLPLKDVAGQAAEMIGSAYAEAGMEISVADLMSAAIDMANDLLPAHTWTELKPLLEAELRALRRFLETQKSIERKTRT